MMQRQRVQVQAAVAPPKLQTQSAVVVAPKTDLAAMKATYQRYKDVRRAMEMETADMEQQLRQLDQRFARQTKQLAELKVPLLLRLWHAGGAGALLLLNLQGGKKPKHSQQEATSESLRKIAAHDAQLAVLNLQAADWVAAANASERDLAALRAKQGALVDHMDTVTQRKMRLSLARKTAEEQISALDVSTQQSDANHAAAVDAMTRRFNAVMAAGAAELASLHKRTTAEEDAVQVTKTALEQARQHKADMTGMTARRKNRKRKLTTGVSSRCACQA
jgi:hypothetical protein